MSDIYQDESGAWHQRITDDDDFSLGMWGYGIDIVSIDLLIEGKSNVNLTDKQRATLANERSEALCAWDAGDFNLARALGTALHRSCEKGHIYSAAAKALKKYNDGLTPEGRAKGGEATRAKSQEREKLIEKAVAPLLEKLWDDQQIYTFLVERKIGTDVGERQLKNHIEHIRTKYQALKSTS